jgi:hypothetical protein
MASAVNGDDERVGAGWFAAADFAGGGIAVHDRHLAIAMPMPLSVTETRM